MDDVITLINQRYEQDGYGIPRAINEERDVLCEVLDITRAEFFAAGRSGFNPDIEFRLFHANWAGEKVIRYHGNEYAVYRTFRPDGDDYIELYAQMKGGTNGTKASHI